LSDDDGGALGLGGNVVLRYGALIACAILLVACATITKGTTQLVAFDTPGVAGATCTLSTQAGPQVVTTPGTLTLSKQSESIPIRCEKACYVPASSIVPTNADAMAAGNVIFGGVIGLGVDAASGAMYKYPDQVTVAMSADPACRSEPPPYSRPPRPRRTSSAQ